MENYPVINKALMKKQPEIRTAQRSARKYYRKGHAKPLKNVLMKVVRILPASESDIMTVSVNSDAADQISHMDTTNISADALIEKVKAAGLTGMSGNGFPVYQKLASFAAYIMANQNLSTNNTAGPALLVNAVECDPGLIHDEWLVRNHLKEIKQGIHIISQAFGLERSILAIKAAEKNRPGTFSEQEGFLICHVPARYPAGEEHFLIQTALGITLPKTELPVSHGILVMNVQTVWQVARIMNGTFDDGRYITAADVVNGAAKAVYIKKTAAITDVLMAAFGDRSSQKYQCIAGGGIMAAHESTAGEVCAENTSFAAYLPLSFKKVLSNENRCKSCGACTHKCPAGIDVRKIVSLKEKDSHADISMLHPEACLHCGSCTWFCHGNKIPEQYVNTAVNNK